MVDGAALYALICNTSGTIFQSSLVTAVPVQWRGKHSIQEKHAWATDQFQEVEVKQSWCFLEEKSPGFITVYSIILYTVSDMDSTGAKTVQPCFQSWLLVHSSLLMLIVVYITLVCAIKTCFQNIKSLLLTLVEIKHKTSNILHLGDLLFLFTEDIF